jgi:hypothetical protein
VDKEVIYMALKAGNGDVWWYGEQALERFFTLAFEAGAAEREECAKLREVLEALRVSKEFPLCLSGQADLSQVRAVIEALKISMVEQFTTLVAEAEREECAKVCETEMVLDYDPVQTAADCAKFIRARMRNDHRAG